MPPKKKLVPVGEKKANPGSLVTRSSPRLNPKSATAVIQSSETADKKLTRSSSRLIAQSSEPVKLKGNRSSARLNRPLPAVDSDLAEIVDNLSSLKVEETAATKEELLQETTIVQQDELLQETTTGAHDLPLKFQIGDHIWKTPEIPRNFFVTGYSPDCSEFPPEELESTPLVQTGQAGNQFHGVKNDNCGPVVSTRIQELVRKVASAQKQPPSRIRKAKMAPEVAGIIPTSIFHSARAAPGVGAQRPPPGFRPAMAAPGNGATQPPGSFPPARTSEGVGATQPPPTYRPAKTAPEIGATRPPPSPAVTAPEIGATQPPNKEYVDATADAIKIPKQEHGAKTSSGLPPRAPKQLMKTCDPLLHKSIVTPPCPVLPEDEYTPLQLRNYSHNADVPDYLIPKVGMSFQDWKEGHEYYNRYARHAGFGTKIGQHSGNTRYLYCSCQGKHKASVSDDERQRDKTSKRSGCKARMRLKDQIDGSSIIVDVQYEHNHHLIQSPSMMVFLHSHKSFDPSLLEYVKFLQLQNVPHQSIMSILYGSFGGGQYLTVHGRDLLNRKAMNSKKDNCDDVQKLLSYFGEMKAVNKEFFFDFEIDDGDHIKNIFWANASCRGAYQDFGDCITFDTTYKTNMYDMPLGVFVGVNNHLQSTIFACALVRDESEESFAWLFRTFLRCMNQKHPTIILTDQCSAMAAAIFEVFINTLHKWCRWHITRKYHIHLSMLQKKFLTFKDEFTALLNWPLMPTEFEEAWEKLVRKYNLHNDVMIQEMFRDRREWISAYFKNVFCARMTSTQRSESMNYIMKRTLVNAHNNLHRFAEQVNNCIFTRGQMERSQTLASMTDPGTRTWYGYEQQFSEEYTRAVFKEMKRSFKKSTLYRVKRNPDPKLDEHNYLVTYHEPTEAFSWSSHEFKVLANPIKGKYSCECLLWEHTGLFCLHVICMLEHLRVQRVPNEYILKRYTKKAKTRETFDRRDYKTVSFDGTSFLYQQNEVLQLSMKVARTSTKSEEQRAFAKQSLLDLIEKLEAMGCSTPDDDEGGNTCPDIKKLEPDMTQLSNGNPVEGQDKQSAEPETAARVYKAPPKSKTKGSGKQTKKTADYKTVGPGKKKKKKQELIAVFDEDAIHDEEEEGVRKCGICGEYKKHNARTCPKRPELAGVDDTAALEGRVGKKKRKRICQGCNMLSDHNVLTCPVLKNALTIARTMEASKKLKNNENTKRRKEEDSGEDSDEDTEEDEEIYEEAEDNDENEDGDDKEDDEQDEEPTPPEPKKRRSSRLK